MQPGELITVLATEVFRQATGVMSEGVCKWHMTDRARKRQDAWRKTNKLKRKISVAKKHLQVPLSCMAH